MATDALYFERLEAFMQNSLHEVRAFAERENKPFEQTQRHVAEWHAKILFNKKEFLDFEPNTSPHEKILRARRTLGDVSRTIESLNRITGTQAFVLAINPYDPTDEGFLGGTIPGREFWRGFRGGGHAGAKTFKAYCLKHADSFEGAEAPAFCLAEQAVAASVKRTPASSIKADVYSNVRSALRAASGVRNAEMKWSNHERLSAYGVRIIGWPVNVPKQNPSSLSAGQNKLLLEALENGSMKFVKRVDSDIEEEISVEPSPTATDDDVDLSWAYEPVLPPQNTPPQHTAHPQPTYVTQTDTRSAEEILRDALGPLDPYMDLSRVPPLRLGSTTEGATHYVDEESNYHAIIREISRKRPRQDNGSYDVGYSVM